MVLGTAMVSKCRFLGGIRVERSTMLSQSGGEFTARLVDVYSRAFGTLQFVNARAILGGVWGP